MENEYYQKTLDFQEKLQLYANTIFRTYGKELVLRLEEYNLLQNKHNCLESSTAIGFILEEFLVSKLEMFTHCEGENTEYIIDRFKGATTGESFDCYSLKNGIKFMINVKAEKINRANDGVAAIGQLYKNYCIDDKETQKSFIVFKVKYEIRDGYEDSEYKRAKPRHLYIKDMETYCLEEVDLSTEHKQDNRSWSPATNGTSKKNNGRLQISSAFRREHKIPKENISYQNTFKMLSDLVEKNK